MGQPSSKPIKKTCKEMRDGNLLLNSEKFKAQSLSFRTFLKSKLKLLIKLN